MAAATPTSVVGKRRARRDGRARREARWFYFFITPWLLGFIFLSLIPLILGFLTSVSN